MTISEEMLMAYADGEGDAASRAEVESAMREDPAVAARIAHHRAMRAAISRSFTAVLQEPVPERLLQAARAGAAATRKTRTAARSWQPMAMAASLLLVIGVSFLAWHRSGALILSKPDGLVAGAGLDQALSSQLSDDRDAGQAAVTGLSFRDKTGRYCRTFFLTGTASASGLACREAGTWQIRTLAQSTPESRTNFRPAASAMSAAVRAAVEDSIEGEPLDRAGEIAARQAGWTATARQKP